MSGAPAMQAKDIPDAALLDAVAAVNTRRRGWAFLSDLEEAFPAFPPKVVRAKAAALIRRRLLKGCACGCRGDFELPR